MLGFSCAKLNIGLRVKAPRPDGYHEIESILYPIRQWCEPVEIIAEKQAKITLTGLPIAEKDEENLCWKAYQLLQKNVPTLPNCHIYLHKCLPIQAGLGGGAANAATTLKLLHSMGKMKLKKEILHQYALELGCDVPFFMQEKPCLAKGRGEKLQPVSPKIQDHYVIVMVPKIYVETKKAYQWLQQKRKSTPPLAPKNTLLHAWENQQYNLIINDFQKEICAKYPPIQQCIAALQKAGAWYTSLSGTGAATYGLFHHPPNAQIEKTLTKIPLRAYWKGTL